MAKGIKAYMAEIEEIKTLAAEKDVKNLADGEATVCDIFARCFCAVKNTLGLTTFDEQLMAGLAMKDGKLVQMATGEGKTLAAVFPACFSAKNGLNVHVLTFNDYLAKRDYNWMKPVYDSLGVSVSYITENTTPEERKIAYESDVVYLTAKEAGFDYLRDFVQTQPEKMIQAEKLGFAIVDEADSILIDEARIPLVIAGNQEIEEDSELYKISNAVKNLNEYEYEIDLENKSVFLTDEGADKIESILKCGGIYDEENAHIYSKVCDCLKAWFFLEENKDYIVKDGQILLVDEFTGRVAKGRHYPGALHGAVEAKHNIKVSSRGKIMGTIAFQFFARRYKKLSGMTGTALSAKDEFYKLYGLDVEEIPTNAHCQRIDNEMEIYTDTDAKWNAVIDAIKTAHEKGQPVLCGTASIGESEGIAQHLSSLGIKCNVLNAKNDELEAKIISNAGRLGEITISTNMAGRGVDIKLGGADEKTRNEVINAGGMLVIATSMSESSRITKQLRGRAGRQGDIGESRLFVSLDDPIMEKYDIKSLVPSRHFPKSSSPYPIEDKIVQREAERIQRISEGDAFDDRTNLLKYTMIGEKHRDITFAKRNGFLTGTENTRIWQDNASEKFKKAENKFGKEEIQRFQNYLTAIALNDFWSEYLDYTSYLREGIHLTQIAGKNPTEEFNIACEEYYGNMTDEIVKYVLEKLDEVLALKKLSDFKFHLPTSTWTYLLDDSGEELKSKPIIINALTDDQPKKSKPKEEKKSFFKDLFSKK